MRTIIFLMCALLMTPLLHAQLEKGQWIVGGSGSFGNSTQKSEIPGFPSTSKTTVIQANEGFGYFFAERLAGGLRFVQNHQKSSTELKGWNVPPAYIYLKNEEKLNGLG